MLFADFMSYEPVSYSWWLFSIGLICILSATAMYLIRQKKVLQAAHPASSGWPDLKNGSPLPMRVES
jgi:hypothetical protein